MSMGRILQSGDTLIKSNGGGKLGGIMGGKKQTLKPAVGSVKGNK